MRTNVLSGDEGRDGPRCRSGSLAPGATVFAIGRQECQAAARRAAENPNSIGGASPCPRFAVATVMEWLVLRATALCAGLSILAAPASLPAQSKDPGARADHYRVPAGTVVMVRLRTPIDSSVSRTNDQVDAVLSDP